MTAQSEAEIRDTLDRIAHQMRRLAERGWDDCETCNGSGGWCKWCQCPADRCSCEDDRSEVACLACNGSGIVVR